MISFTVQMTQPELNNGIQCRQLNRQTVKIANGGIINILLYAAIKRSE